jgi:hypothetical protein
MKVSVRLRSVRVAAVCILLFSLIAAAQAQRTIDSFFDEFTAKWIRGNPNQAVATRYFTGPEQDQLERQLTLDTLEGKEIPRRSLLVKGIPTIQS